MINIVVTSTCRLKLLSQTLSSFKENLFLNYDNYRLVINLDYHKSNQFEKPEDVLNDVVFHFFKKENVVYNICHSPNFSNAVKWCIDNVNSDYFFQLEDDWKLLGKIDIEDLTTILDNNQDIAGVRLVKNSGRWARFHYKKNHGSFINKNEEFSLNPSLFRAKTFKLACSEIKKQERLEHICDKMINPESVLYKIFKKHNFKTVVYNHKNNPIIEDIERNWRKKTGIGKRFRKSTFVDYDV